MPTADLSPDLDAFIARWRASSAAERANYVLFLSELCSVLDLERPNPQTSDPARDAYVFEKPLPLPHGTVGRIDLYKRGCFVLEAKQGSDAHPNPDREGGERGGAPTPRRRGTAVRNTSTWDVAMERARRQAETYARSLPPAEIAGGRPPFPGRDRRGRHLRPLQRIHPQRRQLRPLPRPGPPPRHARRPAPERCANCWPPSGTTR
jgi:hypothetical protein